jgi:hypothetical protein
MERTEEEQRVFKKTMELFGGNVYENIAIKFIYYERKIKELERRISELEAKNSKDEHFNVTIGEKPKDWTSGCNWPPE